MPSAKYTITRIHIPLAIAQTAVTPNMMRGFIDLFNTIMFDVAVSTAGSMPQYSRISVFDMATKLYYGNGIFALSIRLGKSAEDFIQAPVETMTNCCKICAGSLLALVKSLGCYSDVCQFEIYGAFLEQLPFYFKDTMLQCTSKIPYVRLGGYIKLPISGYTAIPLSTLREETDIVCVDFGTLHPDTAHALQLVRSLPATVEDVRFTIDPSIVRTTDFTGLMRSTALSTAINNAGINTVTITILNAAQPIDHSTHALILAILSGLTKNIQTVNLAIESNEMAEVRLIQEWITAVDPAMTLRFNGWQYSNGVPNFLPVGLADTLFAQVMTKSGVKGLDYDWASDVVQQRADISNMYAKLSSEGNAQKLALFRTMLWDIFCQYNPAVQIIPGISYDLDIMGFEGARIVKGRSRIVKIVNDLFETICLHLVLSGAKTPSTENPAWQGRISAEVLATAMANRQRVRDAAQNILQRTPAPAAMLTDAANATSSATRRVAHMVGWLKDNSASTYTFTRDTQALLQRLAEVNRELALLATLAAGALVISRAPAVARIADAGKARL